MRIRTAMSAIGACAVIGVGAVGCGDDNNDKSSGGTKTSSALKKFNQVSAKQHGIGGRITGAPVASFAPGETVDGKAVEQFLVDASKKQMGLDVKAQCPPSVAFTVGGEFFCKLTLPDGTTLDVKCTMQQDGKVYFEIVSNPTPPPPPSDPSTPQLKGVSGKLDRSRTAGGAPRAGGTADTSTVDDQIEKSVKQRQGLDVNVECPDSVEFADGATFYCKLYTSDGTAFDVEVVVAADGAWTYRVITS